MRRLLTVWKALAAEDVWQIYSSIGLMYDRGAEGVARQPSEALFWYRKAVNAGDDPIAHVGLGRAYYEGKGVEKDVTAAYAHFENAYSAGLPESGIYLGTMYQSGLGVKMDLAKAEECFKFSADAGYFYAYFKLARIAFDRRRYLRALKLCVKGWALGVRVAKADPDDLRLLGADMSRRHDKFRA
jgi:TPR repeat protein